MVVVEILFKRYGVYMVYKREKKNMILSHCNFFQQSSIHFEWNGVMEIGDMLILMEHTCLSGRRLHLQSLTSPGRAKKGTLKSWRMAVQYKTVQREAEQWSELILGSFLCSYKVYHLQ